MNDGDVIIRSFVNISYRGVFTKLLTGTILDMTVLLTKRRLLFKLTLLS
jgi:hypothetical protein